MSAFVVRLFLFVLAGVFCLLMCLPVKSAFWGTWADVTIAIGCEDYGSGIVYDRHFDFPTGARYVDIPVWALDAVFFVGTAVAFGFYARSKLQEQKV